MSAPPPARYMADPSRSKRKTPLSGTISEFIASGRSALDTEAACSLLPSPGRTHYWSRRHAARPINPTKPTTRTGRLPGSGTRIIDRGAQLLGSVVLTTLRPLDQPHRHHREQSREHHDADRQSKGRDAANDLPVTAAGLSKTAA